MPSDTSKAAPSPSSASSSTSASASSSQIPKPSLRALKLGDYEVCPLPTGLFGLDGGAMFGTVPKLLWEKQIPADEKNRIPMEARALLLKGTRHKIVIDTGNGGDFLVKYGPKLGPKFAEMYNLKTTGPEVVESLRNYGIQPEEVTHVILTHLHFDHAGGATTEKEGRLVPTFPKAQYFVQKDNLATARKPNLREKASYFAANFEPLVDAGVLNLLEGDVEILPGISVLVSHGHTRAHQMVKVSGAGESLLYCGDVVPTSAHVRLPWVMGYDLEPLRLIEEKKQVLSRAADESWFLYFEHDPVCDGARISRQGEDFQVSERFSFVPGPPRSSTN